jgi:hypothetical protein
MSMRAIHFIILLFVSGIFFSCSKGSGGNEVLNPVVETKTKLAYPDSVFYVTSTHDYFVSPVNPASGRYFSFPEGLSIDQGSGQINVSKSDAGLKYRVSFVENGKPDTLSTFIVISGINYLDGFYNLAKGDSILKPVYNANPAAAVPGIGSGSTFDVGLSCNKQGCSVNERNAEINLAKTVRNGVFGTTPSNNDRHEFEMTYRIKDNSNQADNLLKVKLYFFNSMNEVTQEAFDIISSRQGTIIGPSNVTTVPVANRVAKPRPPCIFIILR